MMKLNSNVTTMMMRCHQHPLNVQIKKKKKDDLESKWMICYIFVIRHVV